MKKKKKKMKSIFFIFLFLFITIGIPSVFAVCGDRIIQPPETCETLSGAFPYWNGTVCCSNCQSNPSLIIGGKVCVSNADCNDGNADTIDTCVSNWCNYDTARVCNDNICPFLPCRNPKCTPRILLPPTCSSNTVGPLVPTSSGLQYCMNETKCNYNLACNAQQSVIFTQPILNAPFTKIYTNVTCHASNHTVSNEVSVTQQSGSFAPLVVTHTISVSVACQYQFTILNNGGSNPVIVFDGNVPTRTGQNQCRFLVRTRTDCPLIGTDWFLEIDKTACCGNGVTDPGEVCDAPAAFQGVAPYYSPLIYNGTCCDTRTCTNSSFSPSVSPIIQAMFCTSLADCNDNNALTLDACLLGWCTHVPLTTTCSTNNDCLTPCGTSTCVLGLCTTPIYNSNLLATIPGLCRNESACAYGFQCSLIGGLTAGIIATLPTLPTLSLTVTPPLLYCGTSLPLSAYVNLGLPIPNSLFGLPSLTYSLTATTQCAVPVNLSSFNSNNLAIGLGVGFNASLPTNCGFLLTVGYGCPGDSRSVSIAITIPVGCCGDSSVQVVSGSSEVCDLGANNGILGSCCSSTCQYTPGIICRNASGVCAGNAVCVAGSTVCPANPLFSNATRCFTATNDCTVDRYCDQVNPNCPSGFKPSGTSCNLDGSLCTPDTCNGSGGCVAGALISYDDGQYCNGLEGCNPATGLIVPGTPVNCADSTSCTIDTCNEVTDSCVHTPVANSSGVCGVSNVGECKLGTLSCDGSGPSPVITCVGAVYPSPEVCVPGNKDENCNGLVDEACATVGCATDLDCGVVQITQCQRAFCNASNVCQVVPLNAGTPCNDQLGCTTGDVCDGASSCVGTPVTCTAPNSCVIASCQEPLGMCAFDLSTNAGMNCSCGSNLCLSGCTCNTNGQCGGGVTKHCPATGNPCTLNICNQSTAICETTFVFGNCNDGLDCTPSSTCVAGQCTGVTRSCDDGISCTLDSCVEPGGICDHTLQDGFCYIDNICRSTGTVNPSNPCQVCDPSRSTSAWVFTQMSGVSCNDGLACTTNDQCNVEQQTCTGTPVDCSAFSDDCHIGTCNTLTGQCEALPLSNGTSCIIDDYCVISASCIGEQCIPLQYRDCSHFDSQCSIGVCDSLLQSCVVVAFVDGLPCEYSNNVCDGQGMCQAGVCAQGTPIVVPPSGECYTYTCDPLLGLIRTNLTDNACIIDSACVNGGICLADSSCVPTGFIDCDDQDPCTDDYCNATTGCYHTPIENCQACILDTDCSQQSCFTATCDAFHRCQYALNPLGSSCSNGNICDGLETCGVAGTCLHGTPLDCPDVLPCFTPQCDPVLGCFYVLNTSNVPNDGNPCTIERCTESGQFIVDTVQCEETQCNIAVCENIDGEAVCVDQYQVGAPCDDGTGCTTGDTCGLLGACVGTPIICRAPTECELSVGCVGGDCVPTYKDEGTPCGTGNYCYQSACDGFGTCVQDPTPIVTCHSIGVCYDVGQCVNNTGLCTTPVFPNGTPCETENQCDLNTQCVEGTCLPTSLVVCPPSTNPCEGLGVCDILTGDCVYPALPDNTPCDDLNNCTVVSVCLDRACTATDLLDCSSPNTCLTTSCDIEQGCLVDFNNNPCENPNLCFTNYSCVDGACPTSSGTPVDCTSPNPCVMSACNPLVGCIYSPIDGCQACTPATEFGPSTESTSDGCMQIPCKSSYCGEDGTCHYVDDDSQTVGCDNGIYCDGQEYCSSSVCHSGEVPDCFDPNECALGYCDITSDTCVSSPRTDQACMLQNPCVLAAFCGEDSTCHIVSSVQCPPAPTCQISLGCDENNGQCLYSNLPDETECDTGNPCATEGQCMSGACQPVSFKQCPPNSQCELEGVCDVFTGDCIPVYKPDFSSCDDGLGCTVGDGCLSGHCASGNATLCTGVTYDLQCQVSFCDETIDTCVIVNLDGNSCDTGVPRGPCSGPDTCVSGGCVRSYLVGQECRAADGTGCDVVEYCGVGDNCPPDQKKPDNTSCPDSLFCKDSGCQAGACNPIFSHPLPSPTDCGYFMCDETLDAVVFVPYPDGTLCSGTPNACIDHYQCMTGTCSPAYSPSTKSCSDSNDCTLGDHCSGTSTMCIPGTTKDCSSLNTQCTVGVCFPSTGNCSSVAAHQNNTCNADNDPCTVGDKCNNGQCIPGPIRNCSSFNSTCAIGKCRALNATASECYADPVNNNCNPNHCTGGCVFSQGYWINYNSRAKNNNQKVPWPNGAENFMLCGKTWLTWMLDCSDNLAWIKLVKQWIAATLNVYIGACMPSTVNQTYILAKQLLLQCQTGIKTSSMSSSIYKQYAAVLESYNTGGYSPDSCASGYKPVVVSISHARRLGTSHDNQRSIVEEEEDEEITQGEIFDYEDHPLTVDNNYPLNIIFNNVVTQQDCVNGDYDSTTSTCKCYYGWAGASCTECGTPEDPDQTFLCVPTASGSPAYMIQAISDEHVEAYLTKELPILHITSLYPKYPGTNGLSCTCDTTASTSSHGIMRSASVSVTTTDQQHLIVILQEELSECQQFYDINITVQECSNSSSEENDSEEDTTTITFNIDDIDDDLRSTRTLLIVFISIVAALIGIILLIAIYRWLVSPSQSTISSQINPRYNHYEDLLKSH